MWRDGIGEGAFDSQARDEINGIRNALEYRRQPAAIEAAAATVPSAALTSRVPLSYVVCQKEIKTKFFTKDLPGYDDGKFASPVGTTVEGIQGLKHDTFYIQGRAPPGSTRKPVRYIVVEQDESLQSLSIPELTWCLCHDFPNWTGSIKVPSVTMMAHKLAQLAGVMPNSGGLPDDRADGINHEAFVNKLHFL